MIVVEEESRNWKGFEKVVGEKILIIIASEIEKTALWERKTTLMKVLCSLDSSRMIHGCCFMNWLPKFASHYPFSTSIASLTKDYMRKKGVTVIINVLLIYQQSDEDPKDTVEARDKSGKWGKMNLLKNSKNPSHPNVCAWKCQISDCQDVYSTIQKYL